MIIIMTMMMMKMIRIMITIMITIMIITMMIVIVMTRFPAYDEIGTCRIPLTHCMFGQLQTK